MAANLEALEQLIQQKVDEGIFASRETAIESIMHWLDELEEHFFEEQIRNEDA